MQADAVPQYRQGREARSVVKWKHMSEWQRMGHRPVVKCSLKVSFEMQAGTVLLWAVHQNAIAVWEGSSSNFRIRLANIGVEERGNSFEGCNMTPWQTGSKQQYEHSNDMMQYKEHFPNVISKWSNYNFDFNGTTSLNMCCLHIW